ncbi:hypothetical protein BDZ91DRAFT_784498 [Kalaharituber pfeilii]|nr:hypothetical protein BDZ91DRAFT_784498 [Kalaharituber pfeilii]
MLSRIALARAALLRRSRGGVSALALAGNAGGVGVRLRTQPVPALRQHTRMLFNTYRRRVEHDRKTGVWQSQRLPIIAAILTTTLGLLLVLYGYTTYHQWSLRTLHNFPPSVAKELRRALYYSRSPSDTVSYNPKEAIRHFVAALELAQEEGMHPLSREVTGIKIEVARVCEVCGRRDKAVEVLREVWSGLRHGVEVWDRKVEAGEEVIRPSSTVGKERARQDAAPLLAAEEPAQPHPQPEQQNTWSLELERNALLRRYVETGIKLGSLLLSDWGADTEDASGMGQKHRLQEGERVLEVTTEAIIRQQRRHENMLSKFAEERLKEGHKEGVPDPVAEIARGTSLMRMWGIGGEDEDEVPRSSVNYGWLTPVEMAAAFEVLATHYLSTSRPSLAAPLLMHAVHTIYPEQQTSPHQILSGSPSDTVTLCRAAHLMNSLSAALAELPSDPSPPSASSSPADAAVFWSTLSRSLTSPGPATPAGVRRVLEREEECVQARITAGLNLAELRLRKGEVQGAREGFGKAAEEARRVRWEEGVVRGKEGVERCRGE